MSYHCSHCHQLNATLSSRGAPAVFRQDRCPKGWIIWPQKGPWLIHLFALMCLLRWKRQEKFKAARGLLSSPREGAPRTSISLNCPFLSKYWLLICKFLCLAIIKKKKKSPKVLYTEQCDLWKTLNVNVQQLAEEHNWIHLIHTSKSGTVHLKLKPTGRSVQIFNPNNSDCWWLEQQFAPGNTNKTSNRVTLLLLLTQSHKPLKRKINASC